MVMLAASASFDDVAVSAAVRGLKLGKNGPPPPGPKKRRPKKNSKKNVLTPMPPPTPAPIETDAPTDAPTDEPTDAPTTEEPTEAPLIDIPNTAQEEGYTTLVAVLTEADLVDFLSDPNGRFTLFAPTNAALDRLGIDLLNCLLEPRYKDVLKDVLLYHVVNEAILTQNLNNNQEIDMENGDNILINIDDSGTVVINDDPDAPGAEVVFPNMMATNGILHGIDQVLMPPGT